MPGSFDIAQHAKRLLLRITIKTIVHLVSKFDISDIKG